MSRHTTHRMPDPKRLKAKKRIVKILRTVPHEKGFHFYTAPSEFTGETATSLDAFEKKLQTVSADSLSFHLPRGDFQKWIEDTLGDHELARRVGSTKLMFPLEDLRKELLAIVQTHITDLRRELPHYLRHIHS